MIIAMGFTSGSANNLALVALGLQLPSCHPIDKTITTNNKQDDRNILILSSAIQLQALSLSQIFDISIESLFYKAFVSQHVI